MKTKENLAAAFAGESQANRKYLAYGKAAAAEGLPQVAKLFRAVAAAETIHAHAHLKALGGVKTTADNLADAIAGEQHEFEDMYPGFIATAEAEGQKVAALGMRHANAVEQVHHGLFTEALAAVKGGADLADEPIHVCAVCGHTVIGEAPDQCPVCKAGKAKYEEVR